MIPSKLKTGDEVRIVAPSRGIKIISKEVREIAIKRFNDLGLRVTFAKNTVDENWDMLGSSSVEKRVEDIMEAFKDKNVKAIFTIIGGFNSNQLLPYLDYEVIKKNPKIFCGFSDITALLDGIYAQTGMVTYSGPHLSSLGMLKGCEYTLENMKKMLLGDGENAVKPSVEWSDDLWFLDQEHRNFIKNDGYWKIHSGQAEGTLLGGNIGTFNLLLGSKYRPDFKEDTILFIEDTEGSDICEFMRNLVAITYQNDFDKVRAIVIGRFQKGSKITREQLEYALNSIEALDKLPILANVDFGHSTPLLTLPVGGKAKVDNDKLWIKG